jgi:hypothetical protein
MTIAGKAGLLGQSCLLATNFRPSSPCKSAIAAPVSVLSSTGAPEQEHRSNAIAQCLEVATLGTPDLTDSRRMVLSVHFIDPCIHQ